MTPDFDFALGENADMIRATTQRFATDKIMPLAARIDAEDWFPRELWPAMGELGLHGITVEEEFSGLGLGYLEHVIACEEVSRASASIRRAWAAKRVPAAVSSTRRLLRRNSGRSSSASSLAIPTDKVGCVTRHCCAAREKFP